MAEDHAEKRWQVRHRRYRYRGRSPPPRIHHLEVSSLLMLRGEIPVWFFLYRFDGWEQVTIDDRVPKVQDDMTHVTGDWWPILVEKAYAKFNGSYDAIDGGFPRVSMHHLTGGISIDLATGWF